MPLEAIANLPFIATDEGVDSIYAAGLVQIASKRLQDVCELCLRIVDWIRLQFEGVVNEFEGVVKWTLSPSAQSPMALPPRRGE